MKRLTVLFLALTVPIILVAGPLLWAYEPGLPAPGREVLDFYLTETAQKNTAAELIRASKPGAFTAAMSAASYGNGSYFRVSYDSSTSTLTRQNIRPLPFPPTELWCVRLANEGSQQLVMVALHQDLYKAVWATHELSLSAKGAANLLEQVGCKGISENE